MIRVNSHQIFTVKFCPTKPARVDRHAFIVRMNDTDKYTQVHNAHIPLVRLVVDKYTQVVLTTWCGVVYDR